MKGRKMKLSDVMEAGKALVHGQTRGKFVEVRGGRVRACAMGAAYLARYPEELETVKAKGSAKGVNTRAGTWAMLDGQGKVCSTVYGWNDSERLSIDDIIEKLRADEKKETLRGFARSWEDPELEDIPLQEVKDETARVH